MDWDGLRFLVTLARSGSVRAAGAKLKVGHSTVARRIRQLEESLGVKVFDRTVSGYQLTTEGEQIVESAGRVSDEIDKLSRKVQGSDARLEGEVRVTLPDMAATHILMDDFAEFTVRYPEISLEVDLSYKVSDLDRREADIALRFVRKGRTVPDHLIGRKLADIGSSVYASQAYLDRVAVDPNTARWIGWQDHERYPEWVLTSAFPDVPAWGCLPSVVLQYEACRKGMGISELPCYICEPCPDLINITPDERHHNFELWLLSHPDLRDTARVKAFREFIADRIIRKSDIIEARLVPAEVHAKT